MSSDLVSPLRLTAAYEYRRGETVHEQFRFAARLAPAATALVHNGQRIGYGELDALSDHFAAELEDRGVGPGDFVPVLLPRDPIAVAVLLAVLKRGAAYAAMDPSWPAERKNELVRQLSARVVVTAEPGWHIPVWTPEAGTGGRTPTEVTVGGEAPCAVFFTSGSTGTPKGAVIPHFGPARLFDVPTYGDYGPGFVVPQMFPLHWDGPILDLWGPLCSGGTAVIVDEVLQPALLRRLVAEYGVNASCMPVAVFNMIVDEDIDAFAGFRWIVTGSEKVSPSHVGRVMRRHPGIALGNGYGPVESAGLVTVHPITERDLADPGGIPIGAALTDSTVCVLDGDRPCAPGERGEICLGGRGLALYYVDDPERTAEKFVTVVIDGVPERVYRTGDLGYFSEEGVLYYAGRNDWQVKIRGHRIEPGEIEHHADQLPGVNRSAVMASRGAAGLHKALRMWFVPARENPASEADVRAALAERLPAYLVPRDITSVATLPLTRNGKVDRSALQELGKEAVAATPEALPDGDAETVVRAAFRQLLGFDVATDDDGFFQLGGSSLDAARLCARVGTALGVAIPVSQFYRTQTVGGLISWLAAQVATDDESVAAGTLTTGQANYATSSDGFICLLQWKLGGDPDREALAAALGDLHRRHQTLHARYHRTTPPTVSLPDTIGEPEIHFLEWRQADPVLRRPLDIENGAVWRAVVCQGLLGLAFHHIAFDGWSERLVIEDLTTAYTARLAGQAPQWTEQVPSLAELASEEARRLRGIDLEPQRTFWRDRLRTLRALKIPGIKPGPTPPSGPTERLVFSLPAAGLAPWDELGCSRFTYLVAIFGHVLRELTGQRDIGMLLPVAARGNPLLDRAIASRMDAVCLRLRGTDDDVIAEAGAAVTEALAAQDLPFGEVVTGLAALRPDIHAVLNLPVFLLHDHDRASLRLPGCAAEVVSDEMAQDQAGPLAVEVLPTAHGANLRITVRTDRAPIEVADTVGEHFRRVLFAGPDKLRQD